MKTLLKLGGAVFKTDKISYIRPYFDTTNVEIKSRCIVHAEGSEIIVRETFSDAIEKWQDALGAPVSEGAYR